ncbi:MAG: histidine triad nucleotide-binding protein, partial [Nitrolancea sp.]
IFCRIVAGDSPASIVYADDDVTAFRDISPQARVHVLIVPNRHYTSLIDAAAAESELAGRLVQAAIQVARDEGIDESGYRLVTNVGPDAQQSVDHLHFHVLGGQPLIGRLG